MTGFQVQRRPCSTCIYRKDSPLDLKSLEAQVADRHGGFKGSRICHHSDSATCRGFWNRHKDKFAAGQIAQRLGMVDFVDHDTLDHRPTPRRPDVVYDDLSDGKSECEQRRVGKPCATLAQAPGAVHRPRLASDVLSTSAYPSGE
jgi:hypothetical protein